MGLAVFGLALGLYVATLAPGLTWRNDSADGGELIAAAWTRGVAHPPGYPTYLLLAKGFASLAPFLDVAYRFNLFSAVAAALSVILSFLLLERVLARLASPAVPHGMRLLVAGFSSLTMATSPVLWSQATVTEVYALNALFFAGILALTLGLLGSPRFLVGQAVEGGSEPTLAAPPRSPQRERSFGQALGWWHLLQVGGRIWRSQRWRLAVAALLLGLGMGNHVTLAFLIPVLGWLYFTSPYRGPVSAHILVVFFLMGLAVYLSVPVRAAAAPPINWGQANTWEGFRWLVSAEIYRDFVFGIGWEEIPGRVAVWARLLVEQFTVIGVGVGLLGGWLLWERWPRFLVATAIVGLFYSAYAIGYETADSYVYLIPFFLVFTLWMGVGWLGAATLVVPRMRLLSQWSPWAVRGLLTIAIAVPASNIVANYRELDLSKDMGAQQYAATVFQQVGDEALILAHTDAHIFTLWYQRYVQEPDSRVMVVVPHILQFQWYWDDLRRQYPQRLPREDPGGWDLRTRALVEVNLPKGPVYVAREEETLEGHFEMVPDGLMYRVVALKEA